MDILATFSTDPKLEAEGKWFNLSPTAKVLVARSGNDNYVSQLREQMKEAQLDLLTGDAADKVAEKIILDVMSKTILLGWSGFTTGQENTAVPYSRETALKYLGLKDFRKRIAAFSENFEAYRAKAEKDQGNA